MTTRKAIKIMNNENHLSDTEASLSCAVYSLLRFCPAEKEWTENKVELLTTISGAAISNNSQPRDSGHSHRPGVISISRLILQIFLNGP